jgi:hypothetical protein
MRIKQTLAKSTDAIDCMMGDSLKIDVLEICKLQRSITNGCWLEALESWEGIKLAANVLKPVCNNEIERVKLAKEIVFVFSRKGFKKC